MAAEANVKTKLDELSKKKAAAERACSALQSEIETEAREAAFAASQAVRQKHADALKKVLAARQLAVQEWQAELDATATHEWEGRKVSKQKNVGRGYAPRYETIYGIVEVRRGDTEFPDSIKYGVPSMGTAFVRLLKKDGTPGKQIDTRGLRGWTLAE